MTRPITKAFLTISLIGIPLGFTFGVYKHSVTPSKFELAAQELSLNKSQQEALLKIFHLAGYFKPTKLWNDLLLFYKTDNPEEIFHSIMHSLKNATPQQGDISQLNLKLLRKNLFKDNTKIEVEDVKAWMLYVAQNAFNRKAGQERNELTQEDWMDKYKEQYIKAAKELGLIDEIFPNAQEYDEAWIAGASRIGLLARIFYYNKLYEQMKIKGDTIVLAGERPLWANLDGIDPKVYQQLLNAYNKKLDINNLDIALAIGENNDRTKEGKEYISSLADNNNIKLDQDKPFIEYQQLQECPKGLFPGRVYPNYANSQSKKLTESLMSIDLINNFLNSKATIIDTLSINNQRPNTISTARDAAKLFIEKILKGEFGEQKDFGILLISNQPYIKRQELGIATTVNAVLEEHHIKGYNLKVVGVGFSNKQDIPTIHSEMAAYIAELYKQQSNLVTAPNKYDSEKLSFQTRIPYPEIEHIPPEIKEMSIIGQITVNIQNKFDFYTD
ncbi:hypothetical protein [Candidatus Tisiphia endosymbiont of Beris chalybata]|uniref:hypothetical protein n=1 Tax=Candidatus Tisiphia endosymbiont of Beris chalybata TaxID=3066262 RepID=UPI00312C9C43